MRLKQRENANCNKENMDHVNLSDDENNNINVNENSVKPDDCDGRSSNCCLMNHMLSNECFSQASIVVFNKPNIQVNFQFCGSVLTT